MPVKKTYCLQNTRSINVLGVCAGTDTDIRINKKDYENGLRITAKTIGLSGRERIIARITNLYKFGKTEIITVWKNEISLVGSSVPYGTMAMYPKLVEIWLKSNERQIVGGLPSAMISKIINEINQIIGEKHVLIDNINVDQFEMMRETNLYRYPDVIFEKLLIYADTELIASSELIQYYRDIPDDIELIVGIEKIIGTQSNNK